MFAKVNQQSNFNPRCLQFVEKLCFVTRIDGSGDIKFDEYYLIDENIRAILTDISPLVNTVISDSIAASSPRSSSSTFIAR